MTAVVKADYHGMSFSFDASGWFDATVAADRFNRRANDFLELESTITYIAALEARHVANTGKAGIWKITRRGRNGGTWLHPKLAIRFAQWLDTDFSIWCDEQIDQIIRGGDVSPQAVRAEYLSGYHDLHAVIDAKAAQSSKPWAAHLNANRLINKTVGIEAGQRGGLPIGKVAQVSVAQQITAAAFARAVDHHDGYESAKVMLGQLSNLISVRMPVATIEQATHPPPRKGEAPAAPTAGASIEAHGANRADLLTQNPSQEPDHAER